MVQNLVHLGRFLDFSQKVVGVTLKTEVFIRNLQFTYRAKFSAFGRFLDFRQKVVGVTLKTEGRTKFSGFR